jgi:hypothetical protein
MAVPNPAHDPTDGLLIPCYVQVTGTNITNRASGGLTVALEATANDTTGLNGQGYGAVAGSITSYQPNAQYALTLSLAAKTYGGTAYAATCQLTAVLKDVENVTYSGTAGEVLYVSYGDPDNKGGSAPAWYNPSRYSDTLSTSPAYDENVASVSSAGLITANAIGQCIIEVKYPTFDVDADLTHIAAVNNVTNVEADYIYAQIVVTVVA